MRLPIIPAIGPRVGLLIAALALFAFLAWFGPTQCEKLRSERAQSRVDRAQGGAFQDSVQDAVGTLDGTRDNALETEQTGDQHEAAIRAAPGNAPIARSINRAARRGMCDYRANRNKPECVVHEPDPE